MGDSFLDAHQTVGFEIAYPKPVLFAMCLRFPRKNTRTHSEEPFFQIEHVSGNDRSW